MLGSFEVRAVRGVIAALTLALLADAWPGEVRGEEPVTLFAAASTADAVEELVARYLVGQDGQDGGDGDARVRAVFAASSTLAKQIAQGAPADLYLSANPAWMDYLAERGAIAPGSRVDLLGNRLVLIAPAGAAPQRLGPDFALDMLLGDKPFVIADPDHVPAGIYAEAALRTAGLWEALDGRTLRAANVRAALALVDRGEAGAGAVYATDAAFSSRVVVVDSFPPTSHPAIVYPLALVAGRGRPEVLAFYDYLRGPEAGQAFRARGFLPAPGGGS